MIPFFPSRRPTRREREERLQIEADARAAIEMGDEARAMASANPRILARITALQNPTYRQAVYAWEYAVAEDGVYRRDEAGMQGEATGAPPDSGDLPAWEVTGNCRVPLDGTAIVELLPSAGGVYYSFFWPEGPVVAKLTAAGATGSNPYAWREQLAEPGGGYVDHPAGRIGNMAENPAYELNGRRVALGSIVFLERGYSSPPDIVTAILVHGDGGTTGQAQTVYLTNAIGGSFTLTFFDALGASYRIGPFPYRTGHEAIQDALRAVPAFATAAVSGLGVEAFPFLIEMGTTADPAPIVGDPFQLEGRQEWHFDGQPLPEECTDVHIRTLQFDRCDYPVLNRYQLTEVYKCGALQFPVAEPVLLYAVGCCDCSGSGPPESGSGSEKSGSGPCPCPDPPAAVTLYATGIANGACTECAALAAGLVLVETAPCVWSGTDGGIVCAIGVLSFELFYSDNAWQLFIWFTDAAGVLHLAAVYTAPAWDCTAQLELELSYDGNGPCVWPPVIIVVPGMPGAGPYWCVQVLPESGSSGSSGAPCCPCWGAYVDTTVAGGGGTIETDCCPELMPLFIPLHFGGNLGPALGTTFVKYLSDTNSWQATAGGCGDTLTLTLSCNSPPLQWQLFVADSTGAVIAVAEWGNFGHLPVCGDGSPATFTQFTGPSDNPCAGAFTATADFGGGDAPPCGKAFTSWGAVQYCDAGGNLLNRPYFDGSIPCLTLVGYYPSEGEAAQAAATYAGTGVVSVPSAPCGPECDGSGSGSGSGPVSTAYNWCVNCTGGPLAGEVVCVGGAAAWFVGAAVTWACGMGPGDPCTGTVVSGPYTDDCGGGCAQLPSGSVLPPPMGLAGGVVRGVAGGLAGGLAGDPLGGSAVPVFPLPAPGALVCLPQSMLTGTIGVGGLVSGPWGVGTIVNGPWPGPDCGGACLEVPPPPPCCFPLPDRIWATCGDMLADFGSFPLDSTTPGSGVGPWICKWWPRVAPTACGWLTAEASCSEGSGLFTVSGTLYAPPGFGNVPPVPYAAFTAEAAPIECKPLLVALAGAPDNAGPNTVQPIGDPGPCSLDDFKITLTD